MIQTGIQVNKIGKFLKDYLSVLIIIPAFIGGLWQALELMSISIPYIRFFSISQIVPDGILILFFIVIASIATLFSLFADTLFFTKNESKPTVLGEDDYEIYRKKQLKYWIIVFSLFYIGAVYYYVWFMFDKPKFSEFKSDISFSFCMILWLNISLNRCYNYAKEKHKEIVKFCNIFLLGLYVIIGFNFSKRIHNIFIAPSNIINIEQVKNDVIHKYPNTKQELLYFNDKYIFIKIINKLKMDKKGRVIKHTSEKIYILKFENLFDESLKN
ncbi:hypothetical protein D3C85_431880 [compost metagenome]